MPPSVSKSPLLNFCEAITSAGGKVYEVGGTVRDEFLGREIKDRDLLVTGVPIDNLTQLLKQYGDVFTVGKSFGVIKFYPKHSPDSCFDIALPRKEVSTGTGHRDFQVDFDPSLPVEIDLSRRDFTINAMAREIQTGQLIDPFNGQADIQSKTIRMVSKEAFQEDPLRLMRGIQFAARFNLKIESDTLASMQSAASLINTVSPERISQELKKLFSAEKPSIGFHLMLKIGILKDLFPEIHENVGVEQGNKLHKDDVFLHTMRVLDAARKDVAIPYAGDLELVISALFHDVGKARTKRFDKDKNRLTFYGHQSLSKRMARVRMEALKMTTMGINPNNVLRLVDNHMFQTKAHFTDRAVRRFVNKIGPDLILKLVDLRLADNRGGKYPEGIKGVLRLRQRIEHEIESKSPFNIKDLAVRGTDLMELSIPEGPEIGKILKELVEVVLDDPSLNTKEALLDIVKKNRNLS